MKAVCVKLSTRDDRGSGVFRVFGPSMCELAVADTALTDCDTNATCLVMEFGKDREVGKMIVNIAAIVVARVSARCGPAEMVFLSPFVCINYSPYIYSSLLLFRSQ